MTVLAFKTSSDFGNEVFLDIVHDGLNSLNDIDDALSNRDLRLEAGCPDASVTEPLNIIWKKMREVKMQEFDSIDPFVEGLVRANVVSANRTEQSVRPQLTFGRTVASQNWKGKNLRINRLDSSHFTKSRNGSLTLCSGISVFKNPRIIDK